MSSIRLESIDSFALQSTRLTESRFARHLVKRRLKCYEEGQKLWTIRLDSTRIDRFVCPTFDPSYRKLIRKTLS